MEHIRTGVGITASVRRNLRDGTITVEGRLSVAGPNRVYWMAPAPTTRGIGFTGSGQAYPNRAIAFENTPHHGEFDTPDGSFRIQLQDMPAGYFSRFGSAYVPPCVEFFATGRGGQRFHTVLFLVPPAAGAAVATATPQWFENQEARLRARAYPSERAAYGLSADA